MSSALGLMGVVAGPQSLAWPAVVVLGLGLGAGFALALSLFALRSPDAPTTAALSAMGQGIGYLIGVLGLLGAGALHDVSGTWGVAPRRTADHVRRTDPRRAPRGQGPYPHRPLSALTGRRSRSCAVRRTGRPVCCRVRPRR
ncbi:hypothetical protein C3492_25170 [Streptomyces sp. Ru62]|uniref:hypothetical protein n=1 Tax=Streptomyces sp. Ru62 TaxID=2080745 RepID=UPI000CDD9252|nr:hypothetical protein [Streptomyces sp. Ru62]POX60973.1 hypothetical protein C3492_25170 [Streptomyces sp. Ru62]